jgi:NAD(P)-dependent dehydrogenase (short-subunit alcohol dehydrogenase family)
MDVADLDSHAKIVHKVFNQFGKLDYLFLNAARFRANRFEVSYHSQTKLLDNFSFDFNFRT